VALQGARAYFGAGSGRWMLAETTEVAHAMRELAPTHHLALVTPLMSWDINSTFRYLARGVRAQTKLTALDPRAPWIGSPARDVAFVVDARKAPLVAVIRRRYPDAPVLERRGSGGELRAVVILVPRDEVLRAEAALSAAGARPGSP
jgi:hypothetical protein